MPGTDPITAIVDQLAAHAEQLTRLDTREADHHAAASSRLAELTGQAAAIGQVVREHAAALGHLTAPSPADRETGGYHPNQAPAWWKLTADDRQEHSDEGLARTLSARAREESAVDGQSDGKDGEHAPVVAFEVAGADRRLRVAEP